MTRKESHSLLLSSGLEGSSFYSDSSFSPKNEVLGSAQRPPHVGGRKLISRDSPVQLCYKRHPSMSSNAEEKLRQCVPGTRAGDCDCAVVIISIEPAGGGGAVAEGCARRGANVEEGNGD